MATIQIEIESDGIDCGKCRLLGEHGCTLWYPSEQVLSRGNWTRTDQCIAAEVTVGGYVPMFLSGLGEK